jgi:hypothetical protein
MDWLGKQLQLLLGNHEWRQEREASETKLVTDAESRRLLVRVAWSIQDQQNYPDNKSNEWIG